MRRWLVAAAGMAWGCSGPSTTDEGTTTPEVPFVTLGQTPCDPLVEQHCLLPFPSDRFLAVDETTATGVRLNYTSEVLPQAGGEPFEAVDWQRLDGASPGGQIMAAFAATPDLSQAAGQDSIDRSLTAESPSIVVDLQTGLPVAHWVELDAQAQEDGPVMVFVRPTVRLEENRSYGVAFRDLMAADGTPITPSAAFGALRDGAMTDDPDLEARRDGMEVLFSALDVFDWDRGSVTLAWRFHTASADAIRGDMLHIRADALKRLGPDGMGCTIEEVIDDYGEGGEVHSARWVRGTIRVPAYVDSPTPPARFVRGADDRPTYQGDHEVPFSAIVPKNLADAPSSERLVLFGHGLLGNHTSYTQNVLPAEAQAQRAIVAATDWAGMSSEDVPTVASVLADVSSFPAISERLHQGMINQIALSRTLAGVCRSEAVFTQEGVELIDPDRVYFVGASQGGIFGTTLAALHPDLERAVLLVGGAGYPFMIDRSIDFAPFDPVFRVNYRNRVDRSVLLSLAQSLWDGTDADGWLRVLASGGLSGNEPQILMIAAHNDAQVTNLATDYSMRTMGLPVLEGSSREPWGFDVVSSPHDGSGYITVDLGDRPVPFGNVAPEANDGGHSAVGRTEAARHLVDRFLAPDGVIDVPCDGICDPD
ncbi:MAG: alpha/beta hydrolase [Myxococcales bacterium]|nr:alpha/beta hydrolase [Myxococcales bacterium]